MAALRRIAWIIVGALVFLGTAAQAFGTCQDIRDAIMRPFTWVAERQKYEEDQIQWRKRFEENQQRRDKNLLDALSEIARKFETNMAEVPPRPKPRIRYPKAR